MSEFVLHSKGDAGDVIEGSQIFPETALGTTSSGSSGCAPRESFQKNAAANTKPQPVKPTGKTPKAGQPKKHYIPCGCKSKCEKHCSCVTRNICCERYCGCSKQCKRRYRGCHCLAGQCKGKGCPCFTSDRECDQDICRNCWVSCGDGSTGEPSKSKMGSCNNMDILIGRGKKIYRGRSYVIGIGWGAFTSEAINEDEFIGEYTGEIVSQGEAKNREGNYRDSSYNFELNDEYVINARETGSDLRFANHSANPNCYTKVMFTGGQHRIGFYAKRRIEAGTELFIDYGDTYNPIWEIVDKVDLPEYGPKAAESNSRC